MPRLSKVFIAIHQPKSKPRGLNSLEIWQMDVTNCPSFGRFKYLHVGIDTLSGALYTSGHIGETAKEVIKYLLQTFPTLGISKEIKTDNGPTYTLHRLQRFFPLWGIKHKTGISHSPSGQSIIERAHSFLKNLLEKQKEGVEVLSNTERLSKALYVFNFLNNSLPSSPIIRHFTNSTQPQLKERLPVLIKDPKTNKILGPYPMIIWGRGHACVSTDGGPKRMSNLTCSSSKNIRSPENRQRKGPLEKTHLDWMVTRSTQDDTDDQPENPAHPM